MIDRLEACAGSEEQYHQEQDREDFILDEFFESDVNNFSSGNGSSQSRLLNGLPSLTEQLIQFALINHGLNLILKPGGMIIKENYK